MNTRHVLILILVLESLLTGEIIHERGSLREFIGGNSPSTAYDNYVSHVVEGIADSGYNDYGPDWLDVQTNGFGTYRVLPNNGPALIRWQNIFSAVLASDTLTAEALLLDSLDTFHYDLVMFTDTLYNREFIMLRERLDSTFQDINLPETPDDDVIGSFSNGWGLYIYNPAATRPQVTIEAPHPCDDFISPYIATDMFLQLDARALMISGTGREVVWTETGDYTNNKSRSDPSRNQNTVFHWYHKSVTEMQMTEGIHSPLVIQMHSFDNIAHEGLKSIVLASGGTQHHVTNKPIRDLSSEHKDIVNFTDEITVLPGVFGPHGMVRVDNYYQVDYDDQFIYYGEYGQYSIPKATELLGSNYNVQLNHVHQFNPYRDVFEFMVHAEADEKPQIFDDIEMPLDTLYAGSYPTSYHNFSKISAYYQHFIDAVNRYLIYWETMVDTDAPAVSTLFYPSELSSDQAVFRWPPVEDTNFKSYRIYYDPVSVTSSSPYFDRSNFSNLMDMRTNAVAIPGLAYGDTLQLRLAAVDYFGNISGFSNPAYNYFPGHGLPLLVEDFENGAPVFQSYGNEDIEPEGWAIAEAGDGDSMLQLTGNTWKVQPIDPVPLDSLAIWQVAVQVEELGEIQGIGFMDSVNTLFYAFYGTEELNIDDWVTVYQGFFPGESWHNIQLPIGEDWVARFEYTPQIRSIVYVNDADLGAPGIIDFNTILDLSPDRFQAPSLTLHSTVGAYRYFGRSRDVSVSFWAEIDDPDSYVFEYLWHFGDGTTSAEPAPDHTYLIEDDHDYSVVLEVRDQQGKIGRAAIEIDLEEGESSLPLTMNFVGDVMLARHLEDASGIIPTHGVNALFEPTRAIFGEAADLSVANLESPLTDRDVAHPTKPIVFKGSPDNASGLAYAGVDVVSLANNHCMDYGYSGLQDTKTALRNNGVLNSGAGQNSEAAYQPLIISKKGLSIAFLASSDRTGQYNNYQPFLNAGPSKPGFAYMTPYHVRKQIQDIRETADLVVMEFHGGSEYSGAPGADYDSYARPPEYGESRTSRMARWGLDDPDMGDEDYSARIDVPHMWDRELRQFAIDEGADLVIVHHPHRVQGLELYQGKLIAHSLGNFIFDLDYAETMPSVILQAEADTGGFNRFTISPVFIDDFIPRPATGALGRHILDYLASKSYDLSTWIQVDRNLITGIVIPDTTTIPMTPILNRRGFSMHANLSSPVFIHETGNPAQLLEIEPAGNWLVRYGRDLLWIGNFEDEGSSEWNINSGDEWLDDNESWDGNRSLAQRRNTWSGDNVVTNLESRLLIDPGSTITVSGYIKTDNAQGVTVQIRFYESRYSAAILAEGTIGAVINGNTEWSPYSHTLVSPDNANFFDIRCSSDVPASGIALSWFDDIRVVQWDDWQLATPGMDIAYPNDIYAIQLTGPTADSAGWVTLNEMNLDYPQSVDPDFSATVQFGPAPLRVQFHDRSDGLVGWWEWDFGEGAASSIEENPSHVFNEPGLYSVSLAVKDNLGNTITERKNNFIIVSNTSPGLPGDINFDNAITDLDVGFCISFVMGQLTPTPEQFYAADVNHDFTLDLFDVLSISDLVAGTNRVTIHNPNKNKINTALQD